MTIEAWLPCPTDECCYEISNLGQVRRKNTRRILIGGRVGGYRYVGLHHRGKQRTARIHRLVLAAFIGPCPLGKEANHKDGNKANNETTNLEYLTRSENHQHALRLGLQGPKRRGPKLDASRVAEIRSSGMSQTALASVYGVDQSMISLIRRRKRWSWVK